MRGSLGFSHANRRRSLRPTRAPTKRPPPGAHEHHVRIKDLGPDRRTLHQDFFLALLLQSSDVCNRCKLCLSRSQNGFDLENPLRCDESFLDSCGRPYYTCVCFADGECAMLLRRMLECTSVFPGGISVWPFWDLGLCRIRQWDLEASRIKHIII